MASNYHHHATRFTCQVISLCRPAWRFTRAVAWKVKTDIAACNLNFRRPRTLCLVRRRDSFRPLKTRSTACRFRYNAFHSGLSLRMTPNTRMSVEGSCQYSQSQCRIPPRCEFLRRQPTHLYSLPFCGSLLTYCIGTWPMQVGEPSTAYRPLCQPFLVLGDLRM